MIGPGSMATQHCVSCCWPVDFLRNLFSQTLGLSSQKERLLDELTLEGVTRYMQSERCECPTAERQPSFTLWSLKVELPTPASHRAGSLDQHH